MMKIIRTRTKSGNVFGGCILAMVLMIGFLASIPVYAQVVGATLSGTITDESGGAVPNATVAILNVATGVTTTVMTNGEGIYNAPNLLPGNYQATISAPGFQRAVQSGIVLTVGAQQVLNIAMKVGAVTQTVEVTAQAPDVQLASSTINGVISSNTIVQLPLNGRSWTALATLQPGVSSIHDIALVSSSDRLGRGLGDQMSINGGRPQQNNYLLDGVSINDYSNQAPGSILGGNLGADAVSEFMILTTNYSTEYGRSSGGVISAITRSGTNTFHGSAYEFLRNSALDTRNFFDGATVPSFRRNQFGVSAGGPIIKDKTFIFADYEGLRQTLGLSNVAQVPSPALRGIGTGAGGGPGPSTLCSNPAGADPSSPCNTQTLASYAAQNGLSIPSPDSTTGIDTAVLPFLKAFYPLPNAGLIGNGDTGTFIFGGAQITSENYFTARVDHRFSNKDSLAGSYMHDKGPASQNDELDNKLILSQVQRQLVTLEETHLFSSSLVNTLRLGVSGIFAASPSGGKAINQKAADTSYGFVPGLTAGSFSAPGLTSFPGGLINTAPAVFNWQSFQVYDNVFLTKGIHSLKFGANAERIHLTQFGNNNGGGAFGFNSLPELLTNNPATFNADGPVTPTRIRETIFGAYLQDDIRFRPNLTINAGLRYEMATVPKEINGKLDSLNSLTSGPPAFTGNPLFANPSLLDFEPRVGFSWDPFRTGKTAIRGGFGMFDVQIFPQNLGASLAATPPFHVSFTNTSLQPGDFPTNAFASTSVNTTALEAVFLERKPRRNYVMQWNVNIQRQIASNTTAMIAYVGSRGVHNLFHVGAAAITLPIEKTPQGYLWPIPNTDPVATGTGGLCADGSNPPCAWPVLNPNWGTVHAIFWNSDSIFHALEVQVTRRMKHGLEAQASYTFGRSVDTSSGSTDPDQFQNGITSLPFFDPSLRRGPSDFNVPHVFTASYTWNIPSPKGVSGVLGWASSGWEFGGIFQANSGTPFTPVMAPDPLGANTGDAYDVPDLKPGCNPIHGGAANYLNLSCFTLPVQPPSLAGKCVPFANAPPPPAPVTCANLMGNARRNSLVGPRLINFDLSLFKDNPVKRISESFNAQFRVEVFNIFNHANFNPPTSNYAIFDSTGALVPGAGQITSTATTSRQIQFALKLVW
jgi:outer membrane receptor protein involved in Fe transport